jgi:hypothetical protein
MLPVLSRRRSAGLSGALVENKAGMRGIVPMSASTYLPASVFFTPQNCRGLSHRLPGPHGTRAARNIGDLMRYAAVVFGATAIFAEQPTVSADVFAKPSEGVRRL